MNRRYGKARVPACECTSSYTCGPCLRAIAPGHPYHRPHKEGITMSATVIDTQDGIQFAHLAALKGALRLENIGMRRRGRSALSIAKEVTGLSTNDRLAQIRAIEFKMDALLAARKEGTT